MDKQEYIVAYNSTDCRIELAANCTFYSDYYYSMKGQYEDALYRYPDRNHKYGDVVGFNNQLWCSVQAYNAKDALDEAHKKWKSQEKQGL